MSCDGWRMPGTWRRLEPRHHRWSRSGRLPCRRSRGLSSGPGCRRGPGRTGDSHDAAPAVLCGDANPDHAGLSWPLPVTMGRNGWWNARGVVRRALAGHQTPSCDGRSRSPLCLGSRGAGRRGRRDPGAAHQVVALAQRPDPDLARLLRCQHREENLGKLGNPLARLLEATAVAGRPACGMRSSVSCASAATNCACSWSRCCGVRRRCPPPTGRLRAWTRSRACARRASASSSHGRCAPGRLGDHVARYLRL